jgi:copper homeostasis protein
MTPSWAQISLARERVSIPLHVLVRPRAGDFVYDDDEIAVMSADIAHCAAAGCEGVVIGALTECGDIDIARCRQLVDAAGALDLTFHRAIDVCRDPARALEDIISLGFRRLLTSGGAPSAPLGAARLRALIKQASGRIAVMPGGGITAGNIAGLLAATGAGEFHASAKRRLPSRMRHTPESALGMGGGEIRTDVEEVRNIVQALRHAVEAA